MVDLSDVKVVTSKCRQKLNERQLIDYRSQREACLTWLLSVGKNPNQATGYAKGTVAPRAYRMAQFYRWLWDQNDRYTVDIRPEDADDWMRVLAREDCSNYHKDNCQKAAKMLLKWRHHEHGIQRWEPEITFYTNGASNPRDYLTRKERGLIREAALEYGSVPAYKSLSPEQRERWKSHLAQRFGKPKSDITPDDWEKANGWKIPSLVYTSLDAGLRPCEIERAKTRWVDTDNAVLRIPKTESSKNRDNWVVGLRRQTADFLRLWLDQRENYPIYDDTETLWLTREGNPYQSQTLRYVLGRLFDIADIPTDNRQVSWYIIRHSTGTYMTREEDLAAAQAQLRHKSEKTTMKYDQTPVEDRRKALDRM